MSLADEIAKLSNLKESGALSEQEFQEAKASLLVHNQTASEKIKQTVDEISSDSHRWGMLIHLTQLCGYMIPLAGLIVPIVLWQMKKDESEIIDQHGRIVANWILTEFIFGLIFGILCMIFIGIPLILALAVASVLFPILGGVKANEGEVWKYPCSIEFFKR